MSAKKKSLMLSVAGIVGIMLILFGTFGDRKTGDPEISKNTKEICSSMEYIEQLENKIGNIAEQITGSGNVRVIVSVSSGTEYIYVSNEKRGENSFSKEYITVRTENGADELVFYDITASFEGRKLFTDILCEVASQIFIPLTVGGGINTVDDFDRVLKCGADKVSVNSGAIRNPDLV